MGTSLGRMLHMGPGLARAGPLLPRAPASRAGHTSQQGLHAACLLGWLEQDCVTCILDWLCTDSTCGAGAMCSMAVAQLQAQRQHWVLGNEALQAWSSSWACLWHACLKALWFPGSRWSTFSENRIPMRLRTTGLERVGHCGYVSEFGKKKLYFISCILFHTSIFGFICLYSLGVSFVCFHSKFAWKTNKCTDGQDTP